MRLFSTRSLHPKEWASSYKTLQGFNKKIPPVANEYLARILTSQVYDAAIETPLHYSHGMSKITGNNVWLKREDLQPVFSFKIRGAYNKIAKLPQDQLEKGIVACSAGNHAQGVALSAKILGIHATIVMPVATHSNKNLFCEATRR